MARNVLLVKKSKGNKTNTNFQVNKEIKAENVKETKETKKTSTKNSSIKNENVELMKEANDNFLLLLESTNFSMSANINFLNDIIIDLLQAENYKPYAVYKEMLTSKKSYELLINEMLNSENDIIHSIDNTNYYTWNKYQLIIALHLAYKKACNGNHVASVKTLKW